MIDFDDEDMEIIHAARFCNHFLGAANILSTDIRWVLRVPDHVLRKWASFGWTPTRICGLRVVRTVKVAHMVEVDEEIHEQVAPASMRRCSRLRRVR